MSRRTFTLRMLRALSLGFLMVWLWQTGALLTGIEAPALGARSTASSSVHTASTTCVLCTADNQASSTADHAHEPPSLVAPVALPRYVRSSVPIGITRHLMPIRFISLIERPPRSSLLI